MSVGTRRVASSCRPMSIDDRVGRSEEALEQHRPLEEAVERVVGGEADARRAPAGNGPRRCARCGRPSALASAAVRAFGSSPAAPSVASSASTATSASASRCRTAWNDAIGRPNCTRSSACVAGERRASSGSRPRSGVRPRAGRARRPLPTPSARATARRRRRPLCAPARGSPPAGSMPRTGAELDGRRRDA